MAAPPSSALPAPLLQQLRLLLDAKAYEEESELCDWTLSDQKESAAAKGVTAASAASAVADDFVPVVRKSVTYIVAAVLFNDRGEVLMMQEAKSSCAGQWYLPAGRMEPGEDICEAARREVQEETGMNVDVATLLAVETAGGSWYRFVVTGEVVGGRLKTPSEADAESLQAKWVRDLNELSLRAGDVVGVVDRARQYRADRMDGQPCHAPQLPALRPHRRLLLRLVLVARRRSSPRPHLLVSERTAAHLPSCELHPSRSLHSTLRRFLCEVFGADLPPHRPHGLLSVEHSGRPAGSQDGCCLTLLATVRAPVEDVCLIDKYSWREVSDDGVGRELTERLGRGMALPLVVIR